MPKGSGAQVMLLVAGSVKAGNASRECCTPCVFLQPAGGCVPYHWNLLLHTQLSLMLLLMMAAPSTMLLKLFLSLLSTEMVSEGLNLAPNNNPKVQASLKEAWCHPAGKSSKRRVTSRHVATAGEQPCPARLKTVASPTHMIPHADAARSFC